MDALPELFTCTKRNLRLTVPGCARLWLSANDTEHRPDPSEGRHACLACSVGARSAGVSISGVAEAIEDIRTLCPRCTRRTDRMIRTRSPGNPVICVSCANRHYEAFKRREDGTLGKNGKGGRPKLCDVLHDVTLLVTDSAGSRSVTLQNVTGTAEAIYAVARKASGPMSFARPVPDLLQTVPESLGDSRAEEPAPRGIVSASVEVDAEERPDAAMAPPRWRGVFWRTLAGSTALASVFLGRRNDIERVAA